MKFFKLDKNSKIPAVRFSDEKNLINDTNNINLEKNNIGFVTGKISNIFVLDIDLKDDGLKEWNKYIKQHGEPLTVTVKTPSGGLHYYFKFKETTVSDNYLISNYLTTKTKYKDFGLKKGKRGLCSFST